MTRDEIIATVKAGHSLRSADLHNADLHNANLRSADLHNANLSNANLSGANLSNADLSNAKLPGFQIPQEGELIVWKKLQHSVLCKLLVPAKARRTASLIGRKCRAEYAHVLEGDGYSLRDNTSYRVGEIVRPDSYDDDIRVECTHGIHFYLSKQEAEAN